ncbi:toll/interleukin-1 receptor domain-containing protein [Agrobacterium rosae]|uniref:toll/interleukin-1 receptor domain-containing protein n=1 Tax=Agrobacterium rosae TaxID=1972867 RepID=UPI003A8054F0
MTFLASPESHWLPWNDASLVLSSIKLNSRTGPAFLSPSVGLAQQLQTTREIAPSSYELMESFSVELRARPSVFISYIWAAATDILPALLPALSEAGFAIWVDRWSGPRRFKDGRNLQPADLVTKFIADAVVKSDLVLALVSDEYDTSRWTSLETSLAQENSKPIVRLPLVEIRKHTQAGTLAICLNQSISKSIASPF